MVPQPAYTSPRYFAARTLQVESSDAGLTRGAGLPPIRPCRSHPKHMKILYVAMKHDYGDPERGFSFEHYNFLDALRNMGHEILYFDFMALREQVGQKAMNELLLDVVRREDPDLMFSVLFRDELLQHTVNEISENTRTLTLNWFCDDHWRFESFSSRWAPSFNWVVTTAVEAPAKYEQIGFRNVIKSQWACNHFLYQPHRLPLTYGVTFVGQPHGNRRSMLETLAARGIEVTAWGYGWPAGRLSQDEMIRVFESSRINLNLANASASVGYTGERRTRVSDHVSALLGRKAAGRRVKRALRPVVRQVRGAMRQNRLETLEGQEGAFHQQIKGRNFEVPGCGGFLLTGRVDDLERYYEPGREVIVFDDAEELAELAHYYLEHEEERASVARAGFERTLREHTYVHRFQEIFEIVGLSEKRIRTLVPEPGSVVEIGLQHSRR